MFDGLVFPVRRSFNEAALSDFENFNQQKIADFRSVLINLAQLEIQLHRKVVYVWGVGVGVGCGVWVWGVGVGL